MALLAESLVEEWLNRSHFFTIRGVKQGAGEMDLLAVQPKGDEVIGWHVEVTVSFQPIGYISKHNLIGEPRRHSHVRKRSREQEEQCVQEWVDAKFRAPTKERLRNELWPGIKWQFHLVHGKLRHPQELQMFESEGVICHPFYELLSELSQKKDGSFSGAAGGDIAEIVSYYRSYDVKTKTEPSSA